MKKLNLLFSAATLVALVSCSSPKTEGDHKEEASPSKDSVITPEESVSEVPMDSAAMAKAWEIYSTPGEMHKWMSTENGKWTAEMSFCMGPDEPMVAGGKTNVETKMIMGGRYQESVYSGDMMGMPFEGRDVMGYDNGRKKFISTWIDNTGTGMMYLEGDYDEAAKTIFFKGTVTNPSTGKTIEYRQEFKTIDDKNHTLTAYETKAGKEYKSMEIKLTRK